MTPDPNAPSWDRDQEIPDCLRSTTRPEDAQTEAQEILAEAIRDIEEAEKRIREGPRTCQVCGAVYCGPDHRSYPGRCPACVAAAMRVVPRKGFRTPRAAPSRGVRMGRERGVGPGGLPDLLRERWRVREW
jgi:predicted Zn-ribbon and HTH transcriptional regulator